jgi:hypothetical protein
MNDLDSRLKETLERHAGATNSRQLPEGTRALVRRRQVVSGASVFAITAAFVAGCLVLLTLGPASPGPARTSGAAVPANGTSTAPDGWPLLGPTASKGFIEDVLAFYDPRPSSITSPVSILGSGTVEGRSWVVTGFSTNGSGDWGGTAGACGHLFVAPYREVEFGICRVPQTASGRPPTVLPPAHLVGVVPGPNSGDPQGLSMYFGVVEDRVARIEVRSDRFQPWQPDLLPGPDGSGVRYFVVFPPPRTDGAVIAFDAAGEVLARLPLCAATPATSCEAPNPDSY